MEEQYAVRLAQPASEVEARIASQLSPPYADSMCGYTGFKPHFGRVEGGKFEVRLGKPVGLQVLGQKFAPCAVGSIESTEGGSIVRVEIVPSPYVRGLRGAIVSVFLAIFSLVTLGVASIGAMPWVHGIFAVAFWAAWAAILWSHRASSERLLQDVRAMLGDGSPGSELPRGG